MQQHAIYVPIFPDEAPSDEHSARCFLLKRLTRQSGLALSALYTSATGSRLLSAEQARVLSIVIQDLTLLIDVCK